MVYSNGRKVCPNGRRDRRLLSALVLPVLVLVVRLLIVLLLVLALRVAVVRSVVASRACKLWRTDSVVQRFMRVACDVIQSTIELTDPV